MLRELARDRATLSMNRSISPSIHPVNPRRTQIMWYFTWILGIGVALGFGIINVMWLDANGKLLNGDTGTQPGEASDRPA
jgi:cyd operon protein YbgT